MVKVAANRSVLRRIEKTRKEVETSTQMLRVKTLKNLKEIFTAASRVAEGQVKKQRIDRRMVPVSLRQRRSWVLVAGHAAKMMKELAENFDEKEVKLQLDKLEKLVEEASSIGATGWSQRKIEDKERSSRNTSTRFVR